MRLLLVGLFVGGAARRMGGKAKGLLPAPDTGEPLVLRTARLVREGAPGVEVCLVGSADAYAGTGLGAIADEPVGVGPLGGLLALLRKAEAEGRSAITVAGDLPYLTIELVRKLYTHAPVASAVAPRPNGVWQPLFARYDPLACLPVAERLLREGRHALHGVLDALDGAAEVLPLDEGDERLLDDWDTLADVVRAEP